MLVFYALEDRSPWFILAFAGACAWASVYGFLQGAWPFGIVEAIWALVAVRLDLRPHEGKQAVRPVPASRERPQAPPVQEQMPASLDATLRRQCYSEVP